MDKTPNLREVQAQREKARNQLKIFLVCLGIIGREAGIAEPGEDFKDELSWLKSPTDDEGSNSTSMRMRIKGSKMQRFGKFETIEDAIPESLDLAATYSEPVLAKEFFFSSIAILKCSADGGSPHQEDILQIETAINQEAILGFRRLSSGAFDFRLQSKNMLRSAAEDLLRYFKLVFDCDGPVHVRCENCSALFISKRGGRKYCSSGCSAEQWRYGSSKRKENLAKLRKTHKERRLTQKGLSASKSKSSTPERKAGK